VGHFIVQLAKIHGLRVISSGGKDDSLNLLKQLGVDHILNYNKDNVVTEILKITENKGVDWVFDATYVASSFENSAKVLKDGGTFILLGSAQQEDSPAAKIVSEKKATWVLADLVPYSRGSVSAATQQSRVVAGLYDAIRYIEQGQLKPVFKTVGLKDVLGVLLDSQKGKTQTGKIVLDISKQ